MLRKLQLTILLTNGMKGKSQKEKQVPKIFDMNTNIITIKSKFDNKIMKTKRKHIFVKPMNQSKDLSSSISSTKRMFKQISSNNSSFQDKNIFGSNILSQIKNKKLFMEKDEIKEFLTRSDNELNSLDYKQALILDNRKFCEYYISLIRFHQILIFAFHTKKDYNSRVIKICYFFFICALVLTLNLLFIDNTTLYHIRITNDFFEILKFNLEKIIYATVISYLLKVILSYLIFSEDIFLNIKNKVYFRKKRIIGNLGMKYVAYFGLVIISLLFFMYYFMCFFAVFPNIQIIFLKISGMSLAFFMLIPLLINIFPSIFRIYSLESKKPRELSYKLSQFLQLI